MNAPADPIACLENDRIVPAPKQLIGSGKPRQSSPNDNDLHLQPLSKVTDLPSRGRAYLSTRQFSACQPTRTVMPVSHRSSALAR